MPVLIVHLPKPPGIGMELMKYDDKYLSIPHFSACEQKNVE